jgi:hypothetical protein
MRKILVATLLLGLGACGGGGLEGEMKDWKDKMCACKDKACAEKTMEDYNNWAKGKREAAKDMSDSTKEKVMGFDKELKACRRKLRDEGGDKAPEGADKPMDKPAEGAKPPEGDKPAEGAK